jgi:integrase
MEKKTHALPKCMHLKHGSYYLVRRNKWIPLGKDRDAALRLYESLTGQAGRGLCRLIDEAIASWPDLSVNTRKQYVTAARHLKHAFADFEPHELLPRHIVEFRQGMQDRPNMGNRCLSVLRSVYDYALEKQMVDRNPVIGIARTPERQRPRLLSPEEFAAIYSAAPPRLQVMMDICYLTGQRIGDVISIRRSQLRDGGIEFVQQKTGKKLLIRSPGLAEVIERAKGLHGAVHALTLFRGRYGPAPKYKSVFEQWVTACKRAGVEDAHLHDLRAMSLTHAKAQGLDATALAGHSSEAMTRRYLRSKEVPEVSGPAMSKKPKSGLRQ